MPLTYYHQNLKIIKTQYKNFTKQLAQDITELLLIKKKIVLITL